MRNIFDSLGGNGSGIYNFQTFLQSRAYAGLESAHNKCSEGVVIAARRTSDHPVEDVSQGLVMGVDVFRRLHLSGTPVKTVIFAVDPEDPELTERLGED